jgi:hypothetical protein
MIKEKGTPISNDELNKKFIRPSSHHPVRFTTKKPIPNGKNRVKAMRPSTLHTPHSTKKAPVRNGKRNKLRAQPATRHERTTIQDPGRTSIHRALTTIHQKS